MPRRFAPPALVKLQRSRNCCSLAGVMRDSWRCMACTSPSCTLCGKAVGNRSRPPPAYCTVCRVVNPTQAGIAASCAEGYRSTVLLDTARFSCHRARSRPLHLRGLRRAKTSWKRQNLLHQRQPLETLPRLLPNYPPAESPPASPQSQRLDTEWRQSRNEATVPRGHRP